VNRRLAGISRRGWDLVERENPHWGSTLAVPIGTESPYAAIGLAGQIRPSDISTLLPNSKSLQKRYIETWRSNDEPRLEQPHHFGISGVFPNLAVKAAHLPKRSETGIGALMPWADKLWLVTYVAHKKGSGDGTGLFTIDDGCN
jgi:hypothetical protein